jgi:hypothetical protein
MAGDFEPTAALHGFAPCETCDVFCQKACPAKAFPDGKYSRSNCRQQIDDDWEDQVPEGETGKRNWVVKFCRACEFSCPVGAYRTTTITYNDFAGSGRCNSFKS